MWLAHSGIHRLEPNRESVQNYRYGLELNIAEFNEGAVEVLKSGDFAYGSPSGVVFFDPKSVIEHELTETLPASKPSQA